MQGFATVIPLIIIGAGGFGREVGDVVDALNRVEVAYDLLGFVDDGRPDVELLGRRGARVLGATTELGRWQGAAYVVAVADAVARRRLDEVALAAGLEPASLRHPSVQVGANVRMDPGLVACGNASITTNIEMGRHVHLDRHVTVGHDTVLGDYVTVHPGATISGNVTLGDGVRVGSNAVITQGVTVGAGTVVGAGAAVVDDLPAGVTAVGVPARTRGA